MQEKHLIGPNVAIKGGSTGRILQADSARELHSAARGGGSAQVQQTSQEIKLYVRADANDLAWPF